MTKQREATQATNGVRLAPMVNEAYLETQDLAAARKAIEAERTDRINRASQRINVILAEEHCQLVAVPTLTPDGRIVALVQLQVSPE